MVTAFSGCCRDDQVQEIIYAGAEKQLAIDAIVGDDRATYLSIWDGKKINEGNAIYLLLNDEIQHCVNENYKKNQTKKYLADYLNSICIPFTVSNDDLILKSDKITINFNSKGICRGYSGYSRKLI